MRQHTGAVSAQVFLVVGDLPIRAWLAGVLLRELAHIERCGRSVNHNFQEMNIIMARNWMETDNLDRRALRMGHAHRVSLPKGRLRATDRKPGIRKDLRW